MILLLLGGHIPITHHACACRVPLEEQLADPEGVVVRIAELGLHALTHGADHFLEALAAQKEGMVEEVRRDTTCKARGGRSREQIYDTRCNKQHVRATAIP